MRKTTLSALIATGLVAVAGIAQAETFDSPTQAGEASTMTNGQPNALTTNSPYGDGAITAYSETYTSPTTVLGAGPVIVDSYTYPSYVLSAPPVSHYSWSDSVNGGATETSNVPQRAGEASTMTNGVPNLLTNNYGY